jgi:hypothetical protein
MTARSPFPDTLRSAATRFLRAPTAIGPRSTSSTRAAAGFSFIEVMIALVMLLVGCLAILPLFALGVQNLANRRVSSDLRRVRSEVLVIAQQEVDGATGLPRGLDAGNRKVYKLSVEGYDVQIEWVRKPFEGQGVTALAAVRRNGEVVSPLPPIALFPAILDPTGGVPAPAPATSRR